MSVTTRLRVLERRFPVAKENAAEARRRAQFEAMSEEQREKWLLSSAFCIARGIKEDWLRGESVIGDQEEQKGLQCILAS